MANYTPDAAPSLKENTGPRPKFTTESIFCRPGERAMTRDHGEGWEPVAPSAAPAAAPVPAGVPAGSVQAMDGQWLVPLANGTFAMMGSPAAAQPVVEDEPDDAPAADETRQAVVDEISGYTVAKLKDELTAAGVAFETDANKAALQTLLTDHRLKG